MADPRAARRIRNQIEGDLASVKRRQGLSNLQEDEMRALDRLGQYQRQISTHEVQNVPVPVPSAPSRLGQNYAMPPSAPPPRIKVPGRLRQFSRPPMMSGAMGGRSDSRPASGQRSARSRVSSARPGSRGMETRHATTSQNMVARPSTRQAQEFKSRPSERIVAYELPSLWSRPIDRLID
ncbi:hypothetical protein KIPB_004382 [Kipferlia bialata]|uniref:Uncharacterized protein n=1 Tax=Kipferlia bialata TaxID=797122 RepID=A0A9K3CTQ3_9EUKA|nr:hypothetical protein KIPB_004382 [Kipferlia bialata]|eukprot:g4382.t1